MGATAAVVASIAAVDQAETARKTRRDQKKAEQERKTREDQQMRQEFQDTRNEYDRSRASMTRSGRRGRLSTVLNNQDTLG